MAIKDVRLIDANALIEAICKKCPDYDCKPDATDTVSGCLMYDVIVSAPTIDAQPVKNGHWIEVRKHRDVDGCIVTDYKCSECGIMLRDTNPDDRDSEFYCYHCGANMCGGDTGGDQV